MRWTRTFIPTLRQAPSDAESPSHRLLIRAGLVRSLPHGSYTYLPLGCKVLRRAEGIIRQEMERAGGVEIQLAVFRPLEPLEEGGRQGISSEFHLASGSTPAASPTLADHEGAMIRHALSEIKSYRQLPLVFFQIQARLLDGSHPRHGLLDSSEILLAEAYSFDTDDKGLGRTYQGLYEACLRIYQRAGLDVVPVESDEDADKAPGSHQFIAPSPFGRESIFRCDKCGRAATLQGAECPPPRNGSTGDDTREFLPIQEVSTPGAHTIDQVSAYLQIPPRQLLKTLIYRVDSGLVAALVRGDHDLSEVKLRRVLRSGSLELATAEEIERETGGPIGFTGPVGLKLRLIADYQAVQVCNAVAGANRLDTHLANVNVNRDFRPEMVSDIRRVVTGDACSQCRAPLRMIHGIRVGTLSRRGTGATMSQHALYQDERGEQRPLVMGCYEIPVSRIVATAVEQHHAESGIRWPLELAPYQVHVISLDHTKLQIVETAHNIHDILAKADIDVLWDDREVASGVKFADADLIGIPVRVIVGKRTLESGTVDVGRCKNKDQVSVNIEQLLETVKHELEDDHR